MTMYVLEWNIITKLITIHFSISVIVSCLGYIYTDILIWQIFVMCRQPYMMMRFGSWECMLTIAYHHPSAECMCLPIYYLVWIPRSLLPLRGGFFKGQVPAETCTLQLSCLSRIFAIITTFLTSWCNFSHVYSGKNDVHICFGPFGSWGVEICLYNMQNFCKIIKQALLKHS